jgi:hypothetical protein
VRRLAERPANVLFVLRQMVPSPPSRTIRGFRSPR